MDFPKLYAYLISYTLVDISARIKAISPFIFSSLLRIGIDIVSHNNFNINLESADRIYCEKRALFRASTIRPQLSALRAKIYRRAIRHSFIRNFANSLSPFKMQRPV